ncbi:hypothetical protein GCK32_000108 [Trichostrongylus colubriformis]|uniref:Skp1-related protein n=1 Tax=Trichostrongylus colubriformis TaxID=6319 RepID=A0AAN8FSK8_TRICO
MSLVNLESSDGVVYSLPTDVGTLSSLVQDVIMHCPEDGNATIPLPKVPNAALGPVVEWMRRKKQVSSQFPNASGRCTHGNTGNDYDGKDSELSNWERSFFHDLDKDVLFMVLNTANYMGITGLIASGSSFIAEIISGMTMEETRAYLNVPPSNNNNDEQLRKKYPWLFL